MQNLMHIIGRERCATANRGAAKTTLIRLLCLSLFAAWLAMPGGKSRAEEPLRGEEPATSTAAQHASSEKKDKQAESDADDDSDSEGSEDAESKPAGKTQSEIDLADAQEEVRPSREDSQSSPQRGRRDSESDERASMLFRFGVNEGQGISQSRSLVPVELFPYVLSDDSLFFSDLRFYPTYDLNYGGNAGFGYRYYSSGMDRIWGISGWYDGDHSRDDNYFNQFGVSFETYGDLFDFRTNLYFPFGDTFQQSSLRLIDNSTHFSGNNVLYDQVRSFYAAMKGIDLEAGVPIPGRAFEDHGVRIYGGVYYFEDDRDNTITGASVRAQANILSGLDLGVQVTNDSFYDTRAFVNLSWTFGPLHRSQMSQRTVRGRFGEHVTRNYTVLAPVQNQLEQNIVARDPGTGQAYTFAHVDSVAGGGGSGSVNSPFQTIADAQAAGRDIIFVHAGSVFNGANATVVMNNGERILGDGNNARHFVSVNGLGTLLLPHGPTSGNAPTLNLALGDSVTLASNSEFSGFNISDSIGGGVFGTGVQNVVLSHLNVDGTGGNGIAFLNPTGPISISDTQISDSGGDGLVVNGGNSLFRFSGQLISNNGDDVVVRNTTGGVVDLTGAEFSGSGSQGILVDTTDGTVNFKDVDIENTAGKGIEVHNVLGEVNFAGTTRVNGAGAESIEITDLNNGATVNFNNVEIHNRHDAGMVIDNSDGVVQVAGKLEIANELNDNASALDIQNSAGLAVFHEADITNSTGNPGVNIENNSGGTSFEELNITSNNGTALFANNGGTLLINPDRAVPFGGVIDADNGTAVDIQNTSVNAYLESVSSSNATVGIRLVSVPGVFVVTGDNTAHSTTGGTISGATTGVILQDVGSVALTSMDLDNNGVGVFAQDVDNLGIINVRVTDSTNYGVNLQNTRNFAMSFSTFSGNGLDDVHATFSEVATNAYTFYTNVFDSDHGDSIHLESQGGSAGATMNLGVQLNNFDNSFTGGSAVSVDWNGALAAAINQNGIISSGTSGFGADISNTSSAAATSINMNSNQFAGTGTGATVLRAVTAGPTQVAIANNLTQFSATGGTGYRFNLGASSTVNVQSNVIIDTTDGATGLLFDSLTGPSTVAINNNSFQFANSGALVDRGIIFSSVTAPVIGGTTYFVTLQSSQNNVVHGADTIFSVPAGTTTGHIIINGFNVP